MTILFMPTEDDIPSKTQKKREAAALQALGLQLTQLSEDKLALIPLPNQLMDAILAARKIHQHGGLKRQQQYIGKLMRDIDPHPIKHALNQIQLQRKRETSQFHQLETWREQLINNSSGTMDEILTQYPNIDRQYLRQLIRNAQDIKHEQKSKKASRKLFQYLQELSS